MNTYKIYIYTIKTVRKKYLKRNDLKLKKKGFQIGCFIGSIKRRKLKTVWSVPGKNIKVADAIMFF